MAALGPRLLLASCLVLFIAPRTWAEEDMATRASKRHFERATKLFNGGKFAKALEEYQAAYDAKPIPDFLFNIGQCHRNLGDYESAISTFKQFLEEQPEDAQSNDVRRIIRELERELETRRNRQDSIKYNLEDKPPPPRGDPPLYTKWWFWTGVAVVGVAGGVGIYAATRSSPPDTDLGHIVFGN